MEQGQKTITLSVKKFIIGIGILILIIIAVQFVRHFINRSYMGVGNSVSSNDIVAVDFAGGSESRQMGSFSGNMMFPENNTNGTIADTREFMKVSYSGSIQTRDVKDTTRDVRGIIRDMNGRIDNENVSEKYGSISFVIPKSNLDDFRDEIESITHKKLYTENTSSQNLLNQKQAIEERTDLTNASLSELQAEKAKAETAHTKELASLQAQVKNLSTLAEAARNQFNAMTTVVEGTPEYVQKNALANDYANYSGQVNVIKNKISEENRKYTENKKGFDTAISQFNNQLGEIKKDDKALTENIETVNGTVSIRWVNVWQLVKEVSPIPPIVITLLLVIIVWYILKKLRIVPLIVVKW